MPTKRRGVERLVESVCDRWPRRCEGVWKLSSVRMRYRGKMRVEEDSSPPQRSITSS